MAQPQCTLGQPSVPPGASVLALPIRLVVVASVSVEGTCTFPWDNFLPLAAQCDRVVAHGPWASCPADLVQEQSGMCALPLRSEKMTCPRSHSQSTPRGQAEGIPCPAHLGDYQGYWLGWGVTPGVEAWPC